MLNNFLLVSLDKQNVNLFSKHMCLILQLNVLYTCLKDYKKMWETRRLQDALRNLERE